jgi:lipopolysaccharide transport system ATP-binding protein
VVKGLKDVEPPSPTEPPITDSAELSLTPAPVKEASDSREFGGLGVRVTKVEVLNAEENTTSVFHPGETIKIRVHGHSSIDTQRLNISIRIRNKEGIKIFSWGTLNQDMKALSTGKGGEIFWERALRAQEDFNVTLECSCSLGANLYEIQACISYEDTPDYLNQSILHWVDEAAFFQVIIRRDDNFFGGVVDLGMSAAW